MADNNDNARRDSAPTAGSLPFFARFLEADDNTKTDDVHQTSAARPLTLKYPSDRDEIDWFQDN